MPNLVEPTDPNATIIPPTAQETPLANEQPADAAMPPEGEAPQEDAPMDLLKIPAFQAIFAGSPPALSYDLHDKSDRPERKLAEENAAYLQKAGFGTYKTLSGDRGVLYNGLRIHPDDLAAADRAGKLKLVAPDFDAVNHAVSKSGASHPTFHVGEVPNGPAASRSASIAPQSATQQAIVDRINGAPAPLAQPGPIVAPASAGAQKKITSARMANMQPSAPTGGPAPGQGALLSSIMKPVL